VINAAINTGEQRGATAAVRQDQVMVLIFGVGNEKGKNLDYRKRLTT
jgi:hypothetical protein